MAVGRVESEINWDEVDGERQGACQK